MRRLILVDDDEEEFELLSSALMEITKEVELIHCDGCTNVMDALSDNNPELIFLDINMPTIDGIDCLKSIRSTPCYDAIPVVMYSTSNNKVSIQQSFDCKASLYVVKSYSYEGLLQVLKKVLSIDWTLHKPEDIDQFVLCAKEN